MNKMLDFTREELRADILEIVTTVVQAEVGIARTEIEAIVQIEVGTARAEAAAFRAESKEANIGLARMLTEDIVAVSDRLERIDRRHTNRFNTLEHKMDQGFSELKRELRAHIADPQAHTRPLSA